MTVAVLLPTSLGYCLFIRWPRQRLRACSEILHPSDLRDAIHSLGEPLTVVLIGRRHADAVAEAVLDVAELVVVPEQWLRRVPRTAMSTRADLAVRIANAHRAAQVEHRLRRDGQLGLPF
jgi:hypothetical protein